MRDLHVNLGQSHVLQGVSFDVPEGGVTALLGRNGVGKTTTLRAILGLVGRRGTVQLDGADLTSLAARGAEIYEANECAKCHGERGRGDGRPRR